MIDDEQGWAAFRAYLRTNGHLWRDGRSPEGAESGSILVDLDHHYHRYTCLNLLTACHLQRRFGGRIVGVVHRGLHDRAVVYPDMEETAELARSFGVEELRVIDVSAQTALGSVPADQEPVADDAFVRALVAEVTEDGVPIGRYAYESYLRWTYVETLRDRAEARRFLAEARALADHFRDLFRRERFGWVVSGHMVYNFWGIMSDCALRGGVRLAFPHPVAPPSLYLFDHPAPTGAPVSHLIREADTDTFRTHIWPRRRALAATTAEMVRRTALNLSTPVWWSPSTPLSAGYDEARAALRQAYGWSDPARPIVFVLAHCFSDAALSDDNAFQDYCVWMRETIAIARADTSKYWVFKQHPNDADYVRNGGGARVYEDLSGCDHVRVAGQEMSREQCIAYADLGVTVRGSLGYDLVAHGVPTILAGRSAYSDLGFARVVDDADAYRAALDAFTEAVPAAPEAVEAARLYYGLCQLYGGLSSDLLPGPGRSSTEYWNAAEIAARSNIAEQDRFYHNLLLNLEHGCSKCLDWQLIEHLDRRVEPETRVAPAPPRRMFGRFWQKRV